MDKRNDQPREQLQRTINTYKQNKNTQKILPHGMPQ